MMHGWTLILRYKVSSAIRRLSSMWFCFQEILEQFQSDSWAKKGMGATPQ